MIFIVISQPLPSSVPSIVAYISVPYGDLVNARELIRK